MVGALLAQDLVLFVGLRELLLLLVDQAFLSNNRNT